MRSGHAGIAGIFTGRTITFRLAVMLLCLRAGFIDLVHRFFLQSLQRILYRLLCFLAILLLHPALERAALNTLRLLLLLFESFKMVTLLRQKNTVYMPYTMSLAHAESVLMTMTP
jgi:uncharacterized membrane protein YhfC